MNMIRLDNNMKVLDILMETQMNPTSQQFGDASNTRFEGYIEDITQFKKLARNTKIEKLKRRFHVIWKRNPELLESYCNTVYGKGNKTRDDKTQVEVEDQSENAIMMRKISDMAERDKERKRQKLLAGRAKARKVVQRVYTKDEEENIRNLLEYSRSVREAEAKKLEEKRSDNVPPRSQINSNSNTKTSDSLTSTDTPDDKTRERIITFFSLYIQESLLKNRNLFRF